MDRKFHKSTVFRLFGGSGLLFLFGFVLSMALFPQLHEAVHEDAHDEDHSCAVTLILSGTTDVANVTTDIQFSAVDIITSKFFETFSTSSFFLSGYLRDHAPPSLS